MRPIAPDIPVFKLYGERLAWPTPDLLHCESIPQRSSLHRWEIRPHRHADLFQLLYVQAGEALVEVENQHLRLAEAAIQVVPPLCVHGFRFSEDIQGYVLTLAAPLVAHLEELLGHNLGVQGGFACHPVGADRTWLDALFETLFREYRGHEPGRELQLQSLVNLLMVWLGRRERRHAASLGASERSRQYLARFMRLVEQHYREHLSVDEFAHRIGLSGVYLNSLCRRLVGQSALQVIHQRLLLEAKRNLIYTTMTVNELSDALGFNDPAYFSRFFRRLAGQSPKAFRLSAAAGGMSTPGRDDEE
ncbi:Transcriptional regulator PobR (AraC family) [Azotobacter vinelandii CA]|uniref:Transcriptional regulator PobR (AraC family) n=2 Tax=Azotobacter vinelandii TaxID=354 RepID=C1DQY4_AZOVD|nr:helix-turn-helix domain-containing protein [Azotobacter vinelandii]ACO77657.1 Transcriptional regulator PobR (AraC family) [Azotobacter vinelandii DJ]AGK13879.1 Transcriptional regulator PobR (AraC family) [Azotobacter vinelandii CA]AGK18538.1 Transcriptional regulator PobR (AraC family) [Azotobacter vinelandii CA6]WKN23424.1 helix-turn-helix domain-containing protein [Azotobacter vinelandii]SFX82542.1 transcriptional regulator, AraC family [Azotobacter vinelandii]